jgi:pimeloyl-ACP methyl ester carboxylesterase
MKGRKGLRAAIGVVLCIAGFALAWATPYRETTAIVGAGGCRLVTDVIDRGNGDTQGYVVLFHGLAANKRIMSYLARGFANENLRVFVPDLPGHGRTPGPFSFERAEACADAFVRELIARRAIDPQRTLLAGHSMGGAIALRVAARVGVAGVVAISPAPQQVAHGVRPEMLPYTNPPPLPPHTLAMSAAFEPLGIRDSTRDLIAGENAATGKYLFIPRATHVSVLFDSRVVRASQEWAAETLKFPAEPGTPSSLPLAGSLAGLVGILLLAGPFVREALQGRGQPEMAVPLKAAGLRGLRPLEAQGKPAVQDAGEGSIVPSPGEAGPDNVSDVLGVVPVWRALLEVAAASFLAVVLLRFWNPLSFVRLYNGGYFASFGLIVGVALLLIHHKSLRALWPTQIKILLLAALAGLVLHLLVTGWFDATLTESWLSWARWARFPALFVAALGYLLAEELLLGPLAARSGAARIWLALIFRLIAFIALALGIFVLHSGAILIILLALYLGLFFLFQRLGMDLVHRLTGSAIAAAVFGAILLAGFCLVIFPVT